MTCNVLMGTVNPTHSFTHSPPIFSFLLPPLLTPNRTHFPLLLSSPLPPISSISLPSFLYFTLPLIQLRCLGNALSYASANAFLTILTPKNTSHDNRFSNLRCILAWYVGYYKLSSAHQLMQNSLPAGGVASQTDRSDGANTGFPPGSVTVSYHVVAQVSWQIRRRQCGWQEDWTNGKASSSTTITESGERYAMTDGQLATLPSSAACWDLRTSSTTFGFCFLHSSKYVRQS